MDIEITFINQSADQNPLSIVIFQKNVTPGVENMAVAWKVIENCASGWNTKFIFPLHFSIRIQDSNGNLSNPQPAINGQRWMVVPSASGKVIVLDSHPASTPQSVDIKNGLSMGAMDAQIYKDGRLLATKTDLVPQQIASFAFKPTLWIGVVSQIQQGDILNSTILSEINTEISLLGIKTANIIITGGGRGPSVTPFDFTLVPTS
jgi:hypothetical protein